MLKATKQAILMTAKTTGSNPSRRAALRSIILTIPQEGSALWCRRAARATALSMTASAKPRKSRSAAVLLLKMSMSPTTAI